MKHLIGIIGGSGLNALEGLHVGEAREVETRWGAPSAVLRFGSFAGADVVFLARHGMDVNRRISNWPIWSRLSA